MYTAVFSSSRVQQEVSFLQILSVLSHCSTVTDTEAQAKPRQSHLSQQRRPSKQGFWNPAGNESHSHTPSAFKRPLATASQHQEKSYYRAKRLEKNSTWYQSTRTGTVSKLIDLSPCNQVSLWQSASLHSGASNLWRCYFVGFQTFKKKINWKPSQLNTINLENHLIPVHKAAMQIFCPL